MKDKTFKAFFRKYLEICFKAGTTLPTVRCKIAQTETVIVKRLTTVPKLNSDAKQIIPGPNPTIS